MISPERKDCIKGPISQELLQRGNGEPISLNNPINVYQLMPNILGSKYREVPALEREVHFSSNLTPRRFTRMAAAHGQEAWNTLKRGNTIDALSLYKESLFSAAGIVIANRREIGKQNLETRDLKFIPLQAGIGPLEEKLIEAVSASNGEPFDLPKHLEWIRKVVSLEEIARAHKAEFFKGKRGATTLSLIATLKEMQRFGDAAKVAEEIGDARCEQFRELAKTDPIEDHAIAY